jgi:hypothetical protein
MKIRNSSHHTAERFCGEDGATVFSEGSIVPSPLSLAHFISYRPLEAPQLPISRVIGNLGTGTNLSGNAVNQGLAFSLSKMPIEIKANHAADQHSDTNHKKTNPGEALVWEGFWTVAISENPWFE